MGLVQYGEFSNEVETPSIEAVAMKDFADFDNTDYEVYATKIDLKDEDARDTKKGNILLGEIRKSMCND